MKKGNVLKTKKNKISFMEYLKQPYTRIVIPDSETGTYTAEILEFPGCVSEGKTIKEAYESLERVAESWIQSALDLGQTIPPPSVIQGSGGKIVLRLPKSLHRQLIILSERERTSLNQFILYAISEKVGAINFYNELTEKFENKIQSYQTTSTQILGSYKISSIEKSDTTPNYVSKMYN